MVTNAHVPKVSERGRVDVQTSEGHVERSHVRAYMHVDALTFFLLCALENCSMQKKGNISNDDRMAKACEAQEFIKIDYGNRWLRFESGQWDKWTSAPVTSETLPFTVYKVRVQDFTKSLSTDVYTVRVLDVIKEGERCF